MKRLLTASVVCLTVLTSSCTVTLENPAAAPAAPPVSAGGAAKAAAVQRAFATFSDIEKSSEGGSISRVVYAEKKGDASLAALSVLNGDLTVTGRFLAAGRSSFAGVGVMIDSASGPSPAQGSRVLRIRLSAAAGVSALRVRLVGPDAAVRLSGCYPVVDQPVTPQATVYDIPLSRFVPQAYCGNRGVSSAQTLLRLDAIEVVDAISPVRVRPVQFSVGTISLVD